MVVGCCGCMIWWQAGLSPTAPGARARDCSSCGGVHDEETRTSTGEGAHGDAKPRSEQLLKASPDLLQRRGGSQPSSPATIGPISP